MTTDPNGDFTKSILIIDDDGDSLELYRHLLAARVSAQITTTRFPSEGVKLARQAFFDLILIDVTMNFLGTQFGGFEIYKMLMNRYGADSLMVYSQLITDDLLRQFDYKFNFFEKGASAIQFVDRLLPELGRLRLRQTCFVAMPFAKEYDNLFATLQAIARKAGYTPVRVDRIVFNESIMERIFSEIRNAKLVVFLATDQNPNAFYECGFAVALNKEVITLTDTFANLPFDIRDRTAIAYGSDLIAMEESLLLRLKDITVVRK